MEIAEPIQAVVQSLDWTIIVTVVQGMIVFFLAIWIKNFVVNYHAWLNFKGSMNICLGTWVRLPTATGHVDGQIVEANRNVIRIDTPDLKIFIPTKSFRDRDWVLLKKDALLPEDIHKKTMI